MRPLKPEPILYSLSLDLVGICRPRTTYVDIGNIPNRYQLRINRGFILPPSF
jgi:hypothetical protein